MANNYEQIMALVNAGNKMGLSNTITRDNGIPLDLSSVYATYEDAVIYAATKAIAYQDQIVAAEGIAYIIVAESQGQITVDETVYEVYLKPIGTIPGFDEAENGTLPQIKVDENGNRTLEWVPISAIVEGDGNSVTTLVELDKSVTIADTAEEGFEGHKYTIKVNVSEEEGNSLSLKEDGLFVAVPEVIHPEYAVKADERAEGATSTTYHLTKDGENVDVEIVVPDAYDDTALAGRVTAIEEDVADHETRIGKVEEFFVTAEGETLDTALDTLIEIQKYIDQDGEVAKQVLANTAAIGTLNGDEKTDGSVAKQIADAIAPLATTESVNTALADKADKTALADYYTKTESDGRYALASVAATKDELGEVSTVANNAATKVETLEDKIDEIIADGGEPNVIEYIKVNGTILEVEKDAEGESTKTVNITVPTKVTDLSDGSTLAATVSSNTTLAQKGVDDAKAAKDVADAAAAQAETNKGDIAGHLTRIGALETTVGGHTTSIAGLEGRVTALEGEDTKINEAIGTLQGNVTALQGEDSRLAGLISANADEIAKRANKADVYTKTEADTAISTAIANIPAVDLTPYLKSADAKETYATIASVEAIYKAGVGDAAATGILATLIGSDDNKSARTIAKEEIAKQLETAPDAFDTLIEMAEWLGTHSADAIEMDNRITANENKLAGIDTTVTAYVESQIAAIPELSAATKDELGGVKLSAEIGTNFHGQLENKYLSTDKLVQGTMKLVLFGGNSVEEDTVDPTPAEGYYNVTSVGANVVSHYNQDIYAMDPVALTFTPVDGYIITGISAYCNGVELTNGVDYEAYLTGDPTIEGNVTGEVDFYLSGIAGNTIVVVHTAKA